MSNRQSSIFIGKYPFAKCPICKNNSIVKNKNKYGNIELECPECKLETEYINSRLFVIKHDTDVNWEISFSGFEGCPYCNFQRKWETDNKTYIDGIVYWSTYCKLDRVQAREYFVIGLKLKLDRFMLIGNKEYLTDEIKEKLYKKHRKHKEIVDNLLNDININYDFF
ncbi:MAG: hypothetical protein K9K32_00045 [Halanaerobiales bacterium]|nr:hypothetical protein [Halanaerobiales bacterium]